MDHSTLVNVQVEVEYELLDYIEDLSNGINDAVKYSKSVEVLQQEYMKACVRVAQKVIKSWKDEADQGVGAE